MPRITKRLVDGLGPDDVGRIVRDDELTGFGVRLNADGSRTYLVEYRAGRGRGFPTRRLSIGRHGVLTPEQARQEAKKLLGQVAHGEDPAGNRAARAKDRTVKDILLTALKEHWKPKRKASTAKAFEEMINRTLIPEFGSTRLPDLTRAQIRAWHSKQTHRPRQANLDLAILRKALNLAVADDLLRDNPARGIAPHPEKSRDRVPTDKELRAVWKAIDEAPIRTSAKLIFKLLPLTGCRRGEWQSAHWNDVDLEAGVLRLRAENAKAGARTVPLPGPVVALLKMALRDSQWVAPNDEGDGPLSNSNLRDAWAAVLTEANVKDLHLHDLRHAFATRGAALGANALILRDALGHKTLAMTGRYVSRQTDPVRELSERIAASILGAAEVSSANEDAVKATDPMSIRGAQGT
ncbi:tyrosine-type recombinase/integrase [Microvirga sesbaniae]|uniref:tyrosine-type recombinase/integrase n=1 Tax=Microvirga sesbaniae TaxID=681392 RepID=UPI0021CA9653|nr:site-specific integrase [Microvirga sp. HBU67692]